MGFFKEKEKKSFVEKQKEVEEEKEFDFRKEVKGMTEKQLLKLLVLLNWENYQSTVTDTEQEMIEIAKEE